MNGIRKLTIWPVLVSAVVMLSLGTIGLLAVEGAPRGAVYGVEVYRQICVFCHGEKGDGQGPVALASNGAIKPRDFNDAEYMNTRSYNDLFKAIKEGIADRGNGMMPPQGQTLSDAQIREVIKYIQEFYKK